MLWPSQKYLNLQVALRKKHSFLHQLSQIIAIYWFGIWDLPDTLKKHASVFMF